MNRETVLEYIKSNQGAAKNSISENTGAKGIVLHNILKKLLSDGEILVTGEGNDATYNLAEPAPEQVGSEKDVVIENKDEKTEALDKQANDTVAEQAAKETTEGKKIDAQPATKTPTTRNSDKFNFNGQELGKGPLCRELLRQIVADTPGITFKKLTELYPQELVPRFGLYEEVEAARKKSGSKYDRYFFKEEHVIKLKDKRIVCCNQLTNSLIGVIIARAKELGYNVK